VYNETKRRLFIDFEKAYDSFRKEVLYNTVIEFWVPMKLQRVFFKFVDRFTALCFMATGASFAMRCIRILSMNQLA
jgi:hypothetical protein